MIEHFGTSRRIVSFFCAAAFACLPIVFSAATARAQALTQISTDPFTIPPGQHATEVEPHALSYGSEIVGAFQTGRIVDGGGTDIGFATSMDGGVTWTHGFLPGLTTGYQNGPYDAASDPAVAYDAKHGVWMIESLPISDNNYTPAVVVSRSSDGLTWGNPVSVGPNVDSSDKSWIACDSYPKSPYYGNCYVEWDNPDTGDGILMSTSSDGGMTWGTAKPTADNAYGIGGQPLVQPNGHVVVPIVGVGISVFGSVNGGQSWTKTITAARISSHTDAGGIRSGPLPSAAVDGAGNVIVVWEDCRFRSGCTTNDLVFIASANGKTWSAVQRIPIDPVTSTVDHFIPGVGVDPATSGHNAHIAIHYYYYPQTNCTESTCQLYVGYISSANGGTTWNTAVSLAGPMQLSWLPNSQNGLMVGDYIATAFNSGVPHGIFEVAQAVQNGVFNEATYTAQGLTAAEVGPQLSSAGDHAIPGIKGDPIEKESPEKGYHPPAKRSARRAQH